MNNILVCIKQVPDTSDVKINPETNTLIREGVKSIINPFDMYAIEEAIRLKEKFGVKAVALTMGPPQAEAALKEAISMGIDEAYLVSDRAFAGSDTLATSYTIAKAIKKIGEFSVIFCGKQASDGDTAQVGPGISTHLDIPQVTNVKKIEEINTTTARVERMTEEGFEILEIPLPCLFTVVKEINEPRLPSLKGIMRSKNAKIQLLNAAKLDIEEDRLGLKGSPTLVSKIFSPQRRKSGEIFTCAAEEAVEKLVNALKNYIH
ncbi:MAG: electron transfer flavoprotein subunit beta [Candidatus Omnitrophica bacterium CG1_02_44_16]|nr:MAG: electron transfer flavoprotein subunit beta [Candidatus Omnitrophica bacterium CG1_02_44_16]PIY83167.1 MAG: electron transfer flavoprotein subunit beta [Candidatus Omnitrophica bacterium CG_4_10_14_0_8_um_filter_44_12]PIZ84025.1 MAG: electron transfer flavoprotein subunit beta [Candidatus Omnitrophica bacterium CG_4_10_14_0_2_um_filter_44_9]